MKKEIWKDIKNYEGLYQISNFGRVKRLAYIREVSPRGYKQQIHYEEKILNPVKSGRRIQIDKIIEKRKSNRLFTS